MEAIRVGDWVTQYGAGFWKVIQVFPKYADMNYSDDDGKTWKKGDRIGHWVILKKGFTAKMKPSNACELVDARWCKPVSAEAAERIEAFFAEHAAAKRKFDESPSTPRPAIATDWMTLSEEEAAQFLSRMQSLPERFTQSRFWEHCADFRRFLADPADATHILHLYTHLWEIDEDFQPLFFGPELNKR